jgi:hypothetical protein
VPITEEERAAEAPQPKKTATRKAAPAPTKDDGQGSLF